MRESRGLYEENLELWRGSECGECMEGARIFFRKTCKREYVVVELRGDTFRRLVRKEWVNLEMTSVSVEERLDLAVCFKCSRFGHIGKSCIENGPAVICVEASMRRESVGTAKIGTAGIANR